MRFEDLKQFLLEDMKMAQGRNYQPVMIVTLFYHEGRAHKELIKRELHNANPLYGRKDRFHNPSGAIAYAGRPSGKMMKMLEMMQ